MAAAKTTKSSTSSAPVNTVASFNGVTGALLKEDSPHTTARGKLVVIDPDHGQDAVQAIGSLNGTYGVFSINDAGHWTFELDNSRTATQALAEGEKATDSFVVYSRDGTASQTVTITIWGKNDAATITGADTGLVLEDASPNTATGQLIVNDVDHGENEVMPVGAQAGQYGSFSIAADGNWVYTLDNSLAVVQELAAGQTLTESFTVYSKDTNLDKFNNPDSSDQYYGASKVVTITIVGTNDAAVISGTSTGAAVEDGVLAAAGKLDVADIEAGQSWFQSQIGTQGGYGSFSIDADGQWAYVLDNAASAVQALAAGQTAVDSFTVSSADGTTQQVNITVTGTNDAASISGTALGAATEDGADASGELAVADVDAGEAEFQAQSGTAGTYGSFGINAAGQWAYAVNQASVQSLAAGQQVSESFTVTSLDGTASQQVSVTVTGTNDAAVISGTASAAAVEDSATEVGGLLSVADVDTGEAGFQAQSGTAGAYGSFSINAAGEWSYTLDNASAQVQSLAAGAQASETFTVVSLDGTASQQVTVSVTGTNDAAVITGSASGSVTEDDQLSTSGTLAVADADAGEAEFQAQSGTAGSYGSFSINAAGEWTYDLNNDLAAVQALGGGDQLSETFSVLSEDGGTAQQVTVTINGLDDGHAPVANDDVATSAPAVTDATLTFEWGTYAQNYDYNTGQYVIATGDYQFTNNGSSYYGGGPYVTSWWGADLSYALYSYGYSDYYYSYGSNATAGISMTRTDGQDFSIQSANVTGYSYDYYYYSSSNATLTETITGYNNGVLVAQESFVVPNTAYDNYNYHNYILNLAASAWGSVDRVDFQLTSSNSYSSYYYYNYNYQWIDNIALGTNGSGAIADINVLANDTDADPGDVLSVASFSALSAQGASVSLNADGTLHYDPTALAAYQALGAGETMTDTFTYVAQDQGGSLSNTATVTVQVTGANDAATISGASSASVTEDTAPSASGTLSVVDPDAGQAEFQAQSNVAGNYGSFSINAAGEWTYALNNSASNVQTLSEGQQVTDSFTVRSEDGTASQTMTMTVTGSNDAPTANDDVVQGPTITFDAGYNQYQNYNYSTGHYDYAVSTDGFVFTGTDGYSGNSYGSGPYVTSYWGADYSNALYSYGYNYDYYASTSVTAPITMSKADGSDFALQSFNITGYQYNYYYGNYGSMTETVTGYNNGVVVAQESFSVPDANYTGIRNNVVTLSDPDWSNVDQVVFSLSNYNYNNYYYYYNYAYQWLDNVRTGYTADTEVNINVLANDSDLDNGGDILSVGAFSATSAYGATISLNADGTLHYDATNSAQLQAMDAGTSVYDTFTYQAMDEFGALGNVATVGITISGVAHA